MTIVDGLAVNEESYYQTRNDQYLSELSRVIGKLMVNETEDPCNQGEDIV